MICEICNKKANKVKKCTDCDTNFCEKCGDFAQELCEFCKKFGERDEIMDEDQD